MQRDKPLVNIDDKGDSSKVGRRLLFRAKGENLLACRDRGLLCILRDTEEMGQHQEQARWTGPRRRQ